jgi:glycosyltransferase involved in cell wall biosynthesis
MNILLVHQMFYVPSDPGGTRHYEFGRHLEKVGHKFTVVTSDITYFSGSAKVARRRLVNEEQVDGLRVLRAYTYASLHKSFRWRVVSFLSFMLTSIWAGLRAGPVDLVIGTTPPIFQAISAWAIAFLRRRPFLLEVRDLWPEFAIEMGVLKHPLLISLSRWLERFLYRRAVHILVNSPAYRDYMIRKGIAPEKVTVICNGVDPEMFRPDARGERFRQEWNLDKQFVVTYAGALGLANDIPTILRAANRLRNFANIRFLLVGDGKERPNLEEEARSLALSNVIFTGPRPKTEMGAILAASDVCLATLMNIPLFATTYPNKVFDYMAAGRPTILAIDGVIREVVEKGEGGIFVSPGDDAALATAIENLYGDTDRCHAMGQAAREYVCNHFNRRQQARDFAALVERLGNKALR